MTEPLRDYVLHIEEGDYARGDVHFYLRRVRAYDVRDAVYAWESPDELLKGEKRTPMSERLSRLVRVDSYEPAVHGKHELGEIWRR